MRFGVGVLLVLYATYSLVRPPLGPFTISAPADVAIGIANGLLGGVTGLGGIISTISCQLRGWSKDKQRAVFQPVLLAAFMIISISQLIAGSYTPETVKLYGIGLPFMVAGIWIGFRLYGTIDDETFRKTVLALVLIAGASLIISAAGFKVELEGRTLWSSGNILMFRLQTSIRPHGHPIKRCLLQRSGARQGGVCNCAETDGN